MVVVVADRQWGRAQVAFVVGAKLAAGLQAGRRARENPRVELVIVVVREVAGVVAPVAVEVAQGQLRQLVDLGLLARWPEAAVASAEQQKRKVPRLAGGGTADAAQQEIRVAVPVDVGGIDRDLYATQAVADPCR